MGLGRECLARVVNMGSSAHCIFRSCINLSPDFTSLETIKRLAAERASVHIPVFLKALESSDEAVKIAALDAIGWLRNPKYAQYLLDVLNDTSAHVRYAATANLALCGTADQQPWLEERLTRDTSSEVRARAARVIGFLKLPAIDALINQLKVESDGETQTQIVYALGQLKVMDAVVQISQLLDTTNTALKIECMRALSRIQPGSCFKKMDLEHDDPLVRVQGVRSLAVSDPALFCKTASKLFEDENPGVRCAVVVGLRQLGTTKAIQCLRSLPSDSHPEVNWHLHQKP